MRVNGSVRVRPAPTCLLCGEQGETLHAELRDRMFAVPGTWTLLRCPSCGLVWLHPRPLPQDVGLLYGEYHTHSLEPPSPTSGKAFRTAVKQAILAAGFGYTQASPGRRWLTLGRLLSRLDPFRDLVGAPIMWLQQSSRGRLLDVGCGSGRFLAQMKSLGWDVRGVEPDPSAVRVARERLGLDVTCGALEAGRFPEGSFDVVTLHHVIEHLPDAIGTLRECGRVLKPGGRLVVVTPNVESLGHRVFGSSWRGLEVPRHLQLYSPRTLRRAAERAGLRVGLLRTTANSARWMWAASRELKRTGSLPGGAPGPSSRRVRLAALGFWALERALVSVQPAGEEVVMIATKERDDSRVAA